MESVEGSDEEGVRRVRAMPELRKRRADIVVGSDGESRREASSGL